MDGCGSTVVEVRGERAVGLDEPARGGPAVNVAELRIAAHEAAGCTLTDGVVRQPVSAGIMPPPLSESPRRRPAGRATSGSRPT